MKKLIFWFLRKFKKDRTFIAVDMARNGDYTVVTKAYLDNKGVLNIIDTKK
jgi:hypothetical protein